MEVPSKLLEQIAFNTRPKIEERMLIDMDKFVMKSTYLNRYKLIINNFKVAIMFLTGYKCIFNVTDKNKKYYFIKSITDRDGYIQITISPGAYKIESLNNEIKRIIIVEEHYTESNYPLTIQPNLSTIGSLIETSTQGPIVTSAPYDSIPDPLGFLRTTLYEELNLSPNPVDILSFEISFCETDVAQGKIFKGKRSGIILNFTVDVDLG